MAEKTNAVRLLETAGVDFEVLSYIVDEDDLSATHAAEFLGVDPDRVFKTILLSGERTGPFVCIVPGTCEVDLKKAAAAAGDKAASPLALQELEPLTGYIRGACSPIGMKRLFPTYIDETALLFDRISVSAGKRGLQLWVRPEDLVRIAEAVLADIIV
jgi:Cys-tRNA(Pro)/Cys-tRNA(Cys) deacylase